MQRIPVVSTAIKSVGYDSASKTIEVEFTNGRVYRISSKSKRGIPEKLYRQMVMSDSVGSFYNKNIGYNPRFEAFEVPNEAETK